MNAKTIAGMKKTWNAKNRLSVAPPMVSPARMKRPICSPTTGMRAACAAPTITDHTAGMRQAPAMMGQVCHGIVGTTLTW